ncbi:DUF58 domain-containing protein [Candidatus Woesearchaeota archaeon]|nr:DUF58 domain-containing protein [Candidatus Woesearchaeota archaeon]
MAIELDFLKSLDRLQLILKKKVHADLQGEHAGETFGEGTVFQDYKAYVPGDDFRHIDWSVYARTDKFFIRRFEEERNLTVHILVDASGSMNYGKHKTKFEYAAMLGLGFGHMAMRRNEKFTFATFSEKVKRLRPKKGANQLINIFDIMGKLKVDGESTFKQAMDEYRKYIHGRSLIIIVSDFLYNLEEVREVLYRYRKSEVYVVQVLDPAERELAIKGDVLLEDAETKMTTRTFISRRTKSDYQNKLLNHIMHLKDICEENDAAFVSVTSDTPVFEAFYHILR